MDAQILWRLFATSGQPIFYILYRRAKDILQGDIQAESSGQSA